MPGHSTLETIGAIAWIIFITSLFVTVLFESQWNRVFGYCRYRLGRLHFEAVNDIKYGWVGVLVGRDNKCRAFVRDSEEAFERGVRIVEYDWPGLNKECESMR